MRSRSLVSLLAVVSAALLSNAAAVRAADDGPSAERTPPRLSHTEGRVSFWRDGAEDWAPARVNTPLAPGDQLYTDGRSNLEIQIGPRNFVRAGSDTQLALDSDEPDYLQLRVTDGDASVDLRALRAGDVIEVDTPHGAFTIERSGYYRVEVGDDSTRFTTRRGGGATVTPERGAPKFIASNEEVIVRGDDVESYAASDPDAWDRWNYERGDRLLDAVSYRHVPDDVYGIDDLDHHGRWRSVPSYGSVWFPSRVAVGWAPYTTGRWLHDPYYGWTWVDDAPWGWAPFHYGRWVFVDGFWGWAPGPIVARPVYAPALVAFFSSGGVSVGVSIGGPSLLGWVALGWGEPCHPWWGGRRHVGRPHWLGWGGPRVTIQRTTVINVYRNVNVRNAVVMAPYETFARGPVQHARLHDGDWKHLRGVGGALPVKADPVRVVGGPDRGARPPEHVRERRVVATRAPQRERERESGGWFNGGRDRSRDGVASAPEPKLVPAPKPARERGALERPRSGAQAGGERSVPPPPPRYDESNGRGGPARERARDPKRERDAVQASPANGKQDRATQERVGGARERRAVEAPSRARSSERSPEPAARSQRSGAPQRTERPSQSGAASRSERAARELPGQPADRVYGGQGGRSRSNDRSAAPTARPQTQQRSAPQQRGPQPQAQSSGGSKKARQPESGPPSDATSRGRGRSGR